MQTQTFKLLSWLAGIATVVILFVCFQPVGFSAMIAHVGLGGFSAWVALTVMARVVQVETSFVPMEVLGFPMKRSDLFWIGWIRTFSNQIIPLSGVAAYAHAIRNKTNISWKELVALATPQFVLAALALGVVGVSAGLVNMYSGSAVPVVLLAGYGGLIGVSLGVTYGTASLLSLLPEFFRRKFAKTKLALRKLSATKGLVGRLVLYHVVIILLRGLRIWLLFEIADAHLLWQEALLVVAIAESAMLVQLTPGGLGIREGAILGGASLVGIRPDIAVGVALIDRLFVVGITALLTPPAIVVVRSEGP